MQTIEMAEANENVSTWIKLNVGGKVFQTSKSTLRFRRDSFLARLCSDDGQLPSVKDEFGAILIDRNPEYFPVILDYLRHGKLIFGASCSLEGIREEAEFYNLADLVELCDAKIAEREAKAKNETDLVVMKKQSMEMKKQLMELKLRKMSPSTTLIIYGKLRVGPTRCDDPTHCIELLGSDFIIRKDLGGRILKVTSPTHASDVPPQTVLDLLTKKGYEIVGFTSQTPVKGEKGNWLYWTLKK